MPFLMFPASLTRVLMLITFLRCMLCCQMLPTLLSSMLCVLICCYQYTFDVYHLLIVNLPAVDISSNSNVVNVCKIDFGKFVANMVITYWQHC